MDKILRPARLAVIFVIVAVLLVIYGLTLYKLQIIEGEDYLIESTGTITIRSSLPASRGAILDRNGVILVDNVTTYNIKLSRSILLKSDDPSGKIMELLDVMDEYGAEHNDSFPVTTTGPFSYSADMSESDRSRLNSYFEYFHLDKDISAPDFISWLWEHYNIDYTLTPERARTVIGIRYELELRAIVNIDEYVFAEGIDIDLMTTLLEHKLPFVSIVTATARQYHTTYAAHLLGHMGKMNADEYEKYKEFGYGYDSRIGKDGVEGAFETYLHGKDGSITRTYDNNGAVTSSTVTSEPEAGNNVYLTIDIGLQGVAEESLASTIASINAAREEEDEELATGGAAVVIDVKAGSALVCASYPSFDLSSYSENYNILKDMDTNPLYNRATLGTYNPGSTFKPVTALAALSNGTISRYTTIEDKGQYTNYPDYQPRCWIYHGQGSATHGMLDVVGAIENSCNYFFYSVADMMGIRPISNMAAEFGLGSKTGIEIDEAEGHIATPEYKKEALDEGWWAADTLLACMGQGHNFFTPIQIANYAATLANGGTLYKVSILKNVLSHDYSNIVYEPTPEVKNTVNDPNDYISVIHEGMEAVAQKGTAAAVFKNYPVKVAAKTGTVQSETSSINNGVFICYAPADDPEIAIAVVVEKGGSGAGIMSVAKDILDAYFEKSIYTSSVAVDGELIKS